MKKWIRIGMCVMGMACLDAMVSAASGGALIFQQWKEDEVILLAEDPVFSGAKYDSYIQTMLVVCRSGERYEFYDVPEIWFQRFIASDARLELFHGKFFDRFIYRRTGSSLDCRSATRGVKSGRDNQVGDQI